VVVTNTSLGDDEGVSNCTESTQEGPAIPWQLLPEEHTSATSSPDSPFRGSIVHSLPPSVVTRKTGWPEIVPPNAQVAVSGHDKAVLGSKLAGMGRTLQVTPRSLVTYNDSESKGALAFGESYFPESTKQALVPAQVRTPAGGPSAFCVQFPLSSAPINCHRPERNGKPGCSDGVNGFAASKGVVMVWLMTPPGVRTMGRTTPSTATTANPKASR